MFRKFTYHPIFHSKFQKVFKEFNISLALQNKFTIKNLTKANKTDETPTNKQLWIYQINCADCDKLYIGQTKRNISIRAAEHMRNVKNTEIENQL